MSNEISFDERKKVQLVMLDEIDSFCRNNSIRYSIAFGTLLGAVRHKGFIPWDDDVDIMMPLPDFIRFKKTFKSQLLKLIDIDNDPCFEFPFARIANTRTYSKQGLFYKSYGICIDLYIMIGLPKNEDLFWEEAIKYYRTRLFYIKWRSRLIRRLPITNIPSFTKVVKRDRDFLYQNLVNYEKSERFYAIAGPLEIRDKMIYDRNLFSQMCEIRFENRTYLSIASWDYYLTLRYGDYMELPPEDQRKPYHFFNYYWKK